ncbi:hypothetical protein SAMN05428970_1766 [Agromyces sp. CF514]|uniref:hypothetical protein n=1 Tax=Agromyces sp. CF514 TaxID=1881031 RepID=UPI0008E1DD85|nr:hypothetical protein [Agromyces sp. CF514]SFR74667.1 hypothetical protein SAMN05428970_1766 [Agromyces sp. CF514]
MTMTRETASIWEQGGVPVRLVFRGERWRPVDTPIPLTREPDAMPAALTHPPERLLGWRIRACSASDELVTVDIVRVDGGWVVEHVWS